MDDTSLIELVRDHGLKMVTQRLNAVAANLLKGPFDERMHMLAMRRFGTEYARYFVQNHEGVFIASFSHPVDANDYIADQGKDDDEAWNVYDIETGLPV